ncbi:hypothetical protein [Streptomyces spiramyceticus]|uniref:hypothetical protein n=1 Tax=Streptomyces spiramyceticus TaxID=299717 RepID=UPI00237A3992|nr:hypothetical protein [Streptomyces spiramyceticus]
MGVVRKEHRCEVGRRGLTTDDGLSHGRFQQWLDSRYAPRSGRPAGVAVTATGTWHTGSPTDHRGSVTMRTRVAMGDVTHTYELDETNLGPVLDGAAEFIAWSVLRALHR